LINAYKLVERQYSLIVVLTTSRFGASIIKVLRLGYRCLAFCRRIFLSPHPIHTLGHYQVTA